MKHFIIIFSIVLAFSIILIGCNRDTNTGVDSMTHKTNKFDNNNSVNEGDTTYPVMIYDYSDSIQSAYHTIEYEFADREKYNELIIIPNVELTVGGKQYSGVFQTRQYRANNYYPTSRYLDSNSNYFEIDDNSVLVSYFWGTASSEKILPKEECLMVAKDFITNIIDISDYEIDITDDQERALYTVTFTRYVNGLKSTDCATVVVQYNGVLYSYSSNMLGRVKHIQAVNIDLNKAMASVDRKLNIIYQDTRDKHTRVEFEKSDFIITTLKDGSAGLICSVVIKCIDAFGEFETIVSERVNLVVMVEKTEK